MIKTDKIKEAKVSLVGAGPGDAELITVKGKRLLSEAEVVIYDRLVGDGVLDFINPAAERVFVGKSSTYHSVAQEEINSIIEERAREGKRIVRLKGGDPFIFGRGGEEARHMAEAGISFEVVPGVTAASGVSAYSGIPLTDRELSSAVTLVAGHRMKGRGVDDLCFAELAAFDHTIVFYMALTNLETITGGLIKSGKAPETPAAVVSSATTKEQSVIVSTLSEIAELTTRGTAKPPVVLIVGSVVGLRETLNWL
ncbi:MAG: uroporphyrinogen-III C-methyltransferase [Thermodesulfobacteriota bacterium]